MVAPETGELISRAEVAETGFTVFASQSAHKQVPGRLVVRRIPDLNADPNQAALFDSWRYHAFFTTTHPDRFDTVAADQTHRQHAIIEQVHADLKNSALAHLPSGKFTANAAWLALATNAFNLMGSDRRCSDRLVWFGLRLVTEPLVGEHSFNLKHV